jgi:AcrR family transcriptional regulator
MARKVTISKEVILDNALKMLIRDGYSAVNIKTLAAEIGCSTQPLVWHFENMEGLRLAIAEYAADYARKKTAVAGTGKSAVDVFESMGSAYVKMAIKEPNLFKFLYLGESPINSPYKLNDIFGKKSGKDNKDSIELISEDAARMMITGIAAETGVSEEGAARCIRNTVIYSHGIATMIATGVFKASEKEIMAMIKSASQSFIRSEMEGSDEE